jgi:hypothetical protein
VYGVDRKDQRGHEGDVGSVRKLLKEQFEQEIDEKRYDSMQQQVPQVKKGGLCVSQFPVQGEGCNGQRAKNISYFVGLEKIVEGGLCYGRILRNVKDVVVGELVGQRVAVDKTRDSQEQTDAQPFAQRSSPKRGGVPLDSATVLKRMLFGIVAEGAVADLQEFGRLTANSAGFFKSGLQVALFRVRNDSLKIDAFVRNLHTLWLTQG